uniref:DUF47 family protein n=1 Tax=Staphylothermus marinus TaxID=2280 RepID=A0A7C4NLI5_STAMA
MMIFPGYRGYKEKELIRETDRIVREELYRGLKKSLGDLRNIYSIVVSTQSTQNLIDRVERLIYRIDSLAEKTRHAPYGYKPLFHVFKVDEEVLNKMLEHDLRLGETVRALNNTTSLKPSSAEDIARILDEAERIVADYENMLSERERILSGIVR